MPHASLTLAARFHLSPSAAAIPLIITVARPMSTNSCGKALSCFKGEVLPKHNTGGRQDGWESIARTIKTGDTPPYIAVLRENAEEKKVQLL